MLKYTIYLFLVLFNIPKFYEHVAQTETTTYINPFGEHVNITVSITIITFNNPLKVCFSNQKYIITTQTRPTQIVKVYFLLKNRVLTVFQDYWCTNLITLMVRNSTPTHTRLVYWIMNKKHFTPVILLQNNLCEYHKTMLKSYFVLKTCFKIKSSLHTQHEFLTLKIPIKDIIILIISRNYQI